MKKLVVLLAFGLTFSAGSAFAGVNSITSSGTSLGGQPFLPSNSVTISVYSAATEFVAISHHSSGDRDFGTNNSAPKIYWKSNDGPTLSGNAASGETFGTGWSPL